MRTLAAFRNDELKLLVASDVAARGLDIPDVSHIFNYDVPHHADDYVHRIGRTGRAGKSGDTFMIVTPADSRSLDKVLKLIGQAPDEVVLDVDWSQVKESPRREKGRGERPGGRGERSRGPARDHAPRTDRRPARGDAAMTPAVETPAAAPAPAPQAAAPQAAAPAPAAPAPERPRSSERPRSRPRNPKPDAAPKPAAAAKPDRPREERRGDREDRDDNGVRGFGADTPAFLLRGK